MSNATKCDRCGGYFDQGGKAIRQGFGSDMEEFDLCPDCAEAFDAWMERGQGCERLGGDGRPTLDELSDELRKYIVKADRLGAALDERDDQLADARESLEAAWDDNAELGGQVDTLKAKLDAEAQHARDAWQLWGEADARAEQMETERDELSQRIQTLELEIAKRDKGIERLKRRRGELTEQLGAMADRMAKDGR